MNGFDQNTNLKAYIGSELLQLCIGSNEIILNFFPDGNRITVYNPQAFVLNNIFLFEPLLGFQRRINQIGKTVTGFSVLSSKSAHLTMSDGSVISFKDDSPDFEAVTFEYDGHTIVV
jgi:hypothetical protein